MLIVRAARKTDLDALVRLAEEAGTGFTSLAVPPDPHVRCAFVST